MHSYEIEIKSLLGSKENADLLLSKMKNTGLNLIEMGSHKQLNHYFEGGSLQSLYENTKDVLTEDSKKSSLEDLSKKAKDFSVRTRLMGVKVILVVKASVDETTSSNGTARLEWECKVNIKLEELDNLVLKSGFTYQAKWSRERQEFVYNSGGRSLNVSIDKNAGYGYLSEFEVVINDETKAEEVKAFIRETMHKLGLEELAQDRLKRMFEYYNTNWREFYGTENIFHIE